MQARHTEPLPIRRLDHRRACIVTAFLVAEVLFRRALTNWTPITRASCLRSTWDVVIVALLWLNEISAFPLIPRIDDPTVEMPAYVVDIHACAFSPLPPLLAENPQKHEVRVRRILRQP